LAGTFVGRVAQTVVLCFGFVGDGGRE